MFFLILHRRSHLTDVSEFVDDLVDQRVFSLHFHFRVGTLSSDPVANNTQRVAGEKEVNW